MTERENSDDKESGVSPELFLQTVNFRCAQFSLIKNTLIIK